RTAPAASPTAPAAPSEAALALGAGAESFGELPLEPAAPTGFAAPRLVVLVTADSSYPSSVPGRDDGTIARAFLSRSGLNATVITDNPADAGFCATLVGQADVVVAGGEGVRPTL